YIEKRKKCLYQKRGSVFYNVAAICACPEMIWDGGQCILDYGGLSARFSAPVTCGNLAALERGSCKCTDNDAVLNAAKMACSCKSGFKQAGNDCVRDCGSDADWKGSFFTGYECKCKTSYLSYTASTKSCACSKSCQEDRGSKCQDICPGAIYHPSGDGCKPKCPTDATYKKDGNDWTCDCPNTGEVFTKATSDSGPKCACDSDEKHVKDGKCVSKCPAGATYHAEASSYTCDCSAAIAGSHWDKDSNSCGCPAKNADNEKLILNDAKDKCVLDCGSEAKLSTSGDKCECKITYGTKFDKNLRQCPCDAPEFKASNGVCVPDCGTQATLNRARTGCVCKKSGQKFTKSDKSCACDSPLVWSDGSCHMACGKYANWDKSRKECVCQKRGQLFNEAAATCACPGKKVWDGSQCIPDCGNYATWNGRNKACICDKKGQVFTPSTSTCDCPDGEKWIGNKCTIDCGDEAQLDKRTGKCACYKTGQTFDKVTLECACPASAPEWSSRAKKCFKPKA
ncbi:hypothetical protein BKA59DRAFT_396838, partial [Fusarium tricinctum]